LNLLLPKPPPYDPLEWARKPLFERGRMVCAAWAVQGYGAPTSALLFYSLKVFLYIGAWSAFCSTSPGLGGLGRLGEWWLSPVAFQKAVLWSALFEGLGLGCGSGPLTGRYFPPFGGALYFLRPGTTKLSLAPKLPLFGGTRRTLFDVALYAALCAALLRALLAPAIGPAYLWPIALLVPLLAVCDKTTFLALRGEHYWTTAVVFLFASDWIAGAKAVQLALWFFAGFSKLNHHFAPVVCVMTSNSPLLRFERLRKAMYRSYPDDLRPSGLASVMGHAGTALELSVPVVLGLATHAGPLLWVGLAMMMALHLYITSNVPMGVPIEWNFMVVYGAWALFYAHPEVSVLQAGPWPLALFLVVMLLVVPVLGNLFPEKLSFLASMRYYAGNWACSVWLFKKGAEEKLGKLTKSAAWVYDQLALFYDKPTAVGLVGKVVAFCMMHLHGRALPLLVPKALGAGHLEEYEWVDGEIVAGLVLGWNFGDGHLHDEALLAAVQEQCGFEEGELRCVFIESQPLGKSTLAWRVADAKSGQREKGVVEVSELMSRQPWEPPKAAGGAGAGGATA
jgi:hypothetical protein